MPLLPPLGSFPKLYSYIKGGKYKLCLNHVSEAVDLKNTIILANITINFFKASPNHFLQINVFNKCAQNINATYYKKCLCKSAKLYNFGGGGGFALIGIVVPGESKVSPFFVGFTQNIYFLVVHLTSVYAQYCNIFTM